MVRAALARLGVCRHGSLHGACGTGPPSLSRQQCKAV
jgi:hypothetical protein